MAGYQWGILLAAIVLIGILYSLPRVVVDNDSQVEQIKDESSNIVDSSHDFSLDPQSQSKIIELQKKLEHSGDNKKNAIFADSLAKIYLKHNELDSVAHYVSLFSKFDESIESQSKAGDYYFRLYGLTLDQSKAKEWAKLSGDCFEKVLTTKTDPDIQAKLAVTKVVSANPMEGVMMLRKVLEEYPNNTTALFHLGLLSMKSGQYDKAVSRFETLLGIDSNNEQAAYNLAVCFLETGQREIALDWFQKLKNESKDPAIVESADQYLKILNEF